MLNHFVKLQMAKAGQLWRLWEMRLLPNWNPNLKENALSQYFKYSPDEFRWTLFLESRWQRLRTCHRSALPPHKLIEVSEAGNDLFLQDVLSRSVPRPERLLTGSCRQRQIVLEVFLSLPSYNTSDEQWNRELYFFCRPAKFLFLVSRRKTSPHHSVVMVWKRYKQKEPRLFISEEGALFLGCVTTPPGGAGCSLDDRQEFKNNYLVWVLIKR